MTAAELDMQELLRSMRRERDRLRAEQMERDAEERSTEFLRGKIETTANSDR